MSQTHTAGPWTFWSNKHGAWIIQKGEGTIICQRNDWDSRAAESVANGRLFYAAPDQHEALTKAPRPFTAIDDPDKLSAFIIEYADWFFKVRHLAIAKAEAQP
jgi:hypothetical protein